MTEERKQELRAVAREKLGKVWWYDMRYGGPVSSIPVDVYKRYLKEHWKYYGVDFLSYCVLDSSLHLILQE